MAESDSFDRRKFIKACVGAGAAVAADPSLMAQPAGELVTAERVRLVDADGTSHLIEKDDLFYLPKGWSGTWEILEDMQKLYVIIE